jgi:flagellar basal body rod protein FlgB
VTGRPLRVAVIPAYPLDRFKQALQESRQAMKHDALNGNVRPMETGQQTGMGMVASAKPINAGNSEETSVHERALALRAYRTQSLAANIANADTPHYKAVDIDIEAELRNSVNPDQKVQVKYSQPSQGSVDGNSVEMDIERVKFMDNALRYEYSITALRDHFQEMEALFKNSR